jgi:hypothetical protein
MAYRPSIADVSVASDGVAVTARQIRQWGIRVHPSVSDEALLLRMVFASLDDIEQTCFDSGPDETGCSES